MIDYFAQNLWLAWLLISLLCLLLELTNGDFFIVCFAVGGLFASISSVFTDSLTIQIIVFAITTLLSILPQAGGPTLVSQRRGPPRKQCGRPYRAHRTRHRTDRGQRLWSRADRRRQLEGKDPRRPPRRKRHESPCAQHRLHHHHRRGSIRSKQKPSIFNLNTLRLCQ